MSSINDKNDDAGEQKQVQQDDPSEVLRGVSSSDIHDNSSNNDNDDDDNNTPSHNRSDGECEAEEEAEAEQQRYTQNNLYNALSPDIKQELDLCTGWAVVRQNPIKFVIAHRGQNQILRAEIQKQKRHRTNAVTQQKEEYDVLVFAHTDVLINAIPTVITENIDPLLSEISSLASGAAGQQHLYTIKFRTAKGDRFTLSYMTLSEIFAELDTMALVVAPAGAEEALNTIVNSFRNFDKIKVKTEVRSPGFYLIKGKIKAYNTLQHPMPSKQQIQEWIEFVDNVLYLKFFNTRPELLPTFIKWGVMAPFSFIIKQLKAPFMPALFSYGSANGA
jgi:hypothetical protein